MLDLDLLRSFVSVVDAGGFTRAGERVHRTQSTVSQQIKRLEEDVGQPLLNRTAKDVTPTEAGERLLSYARRLLALAEEARDVMARPGSEGAVRLGVPEDFAAYRLAKLLAAFSRSHPALRLDVRADQSANLKRELERGELDLALFKRAAGEKGDIAVGGSAGRVLQHGAGEGGVAVRQWWCAPSPRSCGERVGVRGSLHECRRWRDRYPLTRIASQSDLSPQAGRG